MVFIDLALDGVEQLRDVQQERRWPAEARRIASEICSVVAKDWNSRIDTTEAEQIAPLEMNRTEVLTDLNGPRHITTALELIVSELTDLLSRLENLQLTPQIEGLSEHTPAPVE
ncbi:hypothetical protein [Georgenia sp. SUBG003]|uniref:hypothetical protein n=1 Tax=Georgenia sp. SUBG003 TaxID=1497974 RepID=UPI003AB740FB